MIRPQVIVWIAFLAGVMTSIAIAAPTVHQGRVTAIGKGEVMILDMKDGESETFAVTAETKIIVDGQPGKLTNIQIGFTAEIAAEQSVDGKLTAKMITATSKISPKRLAAR